MSKYQDVDLEALAQIFRALSNPHRLRVLLMLADCCGPRNFSETEARACVGDICSELGIAPSTVSHHLKELRQAGLIHTARNGQNVECWVDPASIETLLTFLRDAGHDNLFAAHDSKPVSEEDTRRRSG
jgi:ArsR family transcriptional regulator